MEQIKIDVYEMLRMLRKKDFFNRFKYNQLFIVEDKINHETYYAAFLGDSEGRYGIDLYRGDIGLYTFLEIFKYSHLGYDLKMIRAIHRQHGFGVIYCNRDELSDYDYQQIKSLGLSFRGKKQWPLIRFLEDGVVPLLEGEKSEWNELSHVLKHLALLAEQVKQKDFDLSDDEFAKVIIEEDSIRYDKVLKSEVLDEKSSKAYFMKYKNDIAIHRLNKLKQGQLMIEGMQVSYPEAVYDEVSQLTIYPIITAFVDSYSSAVLTCLFSNQLNSPVTEIIESLSGLMLELNQRPKTIVVENYALFNMIKDFCDQISVECYVTETPKALEFIEHALNKTGVYGGSDLLFDEFEDEEEFQEALIEVMQGFDDDVHEQKLEDMFDEFDEQIEQFCIDIVESMLEFGILKKVSASRLTLYCEILQVTIATMIMAKEEIPGEWTTANLKDIIHSNILEALLSNGNPQLQARKEIDTVLRDYAKLYRAIDEKQKAKVIEIALQGYYK